MSIDISLESRVNAKIRALAAVLQHRAQGAEPIETRGEWGWIGYRRQGFWVDAAGQKQYRAHLRMEQGTTSYTDIWVTFWAVKPTHILRAACVYERTAEEMIQWFDHHQGV